MSEDNNPSDQVSVDAGFVVKKDKDVDSLGRRVTLPGKQSTLSDVSFCASQGRRASSFLTRKRQPHTFTLQEEHTQQTG